MRVAVSCVAVVVGLSAGGCAECAVDDDCGAGVCVEGACDVGTDLEVLSSRREADGTYTVVLEARIPGDRSQVRVARLSSSSGDPCVPFNPRVVEVFNDGAAFAPVEVIVAGIPQLGETFDLRFTLLSGGTNVNVTTSLTGPALGDDVGGFTIVRPSTGEIDVVDSPLIEVEIEGVAAADSASVVVRPLDGPSLPRSTMRRNGEVVRASVLLARGPQTIEVEALIDGVVHRCAVAIEGTWTRTADTELLLVAEPQDADDRDGGALSWLELSTRGDDGLCSTETAASAACRNEPPPGTAATRVIHQLTISSSSSLIDVGVVPVMSSVPVSAVVRVTHDGVHVGVFGPMTIAPALGEAWVAGQLVVRDGVVTAVASTTAPQVGLPW